MSTDQVPSEQPRLADFTTDLRVIPLSIICIGIGVAGAYLALILLKLIYLFTNLFFFTLLELRLQIACAQHSRMA